CFLHDDVDLYIHDISNVGLEPGAKPYTDSQAVQKFDLVTCMQVLEHVADPLDLLHTITGFMSSESFLYFELPFEKIMQNDISTDERVTLKRHWHEHVNFFSEYGLAELASRAGMKIVTSRVFSPVNNQTGDEIFQFICAKV
ncbi:MAG: methyltransferase domain-containing protein, partial [Paracoccaceae bacterium]